MHMTSSNLALHLLLVSIYIHSSFSTHKKPMLGSQQQPIQSAKSEDCGEKLRVLKEMGVKVLKAEGFLRFFSILMAVMAASLLGFNRETEIIIIEKKATVKSVEALWVLTIVALVASGYHFLQLCKCFILGSLCKQKTGHKWEAWICLAVDQITMYALVVSMAAAMQGSLFAVTGQDDLQWMKLCNVYRRFCQQVGGGLLTALIASASMALVCIVSAHHCFTVQLS